MDGGKGDQWEFVGGKKSGKNVEALSKSKKKALRDKMPTIQPSAPVEESSTIYEAFIKNEERKERNKELQQQHGVNPPSRTAGASIGGGNTAKKNPSPAVKKDSKGEKKEKPMKLEEVVKNIDVKKFEQWLAKIKIRFPNNPDVWLKDLASLLNNELSSVTDMDPVFSNKPSGYPLTKLPEHLKRLMLNTFEETPLEELPGLVKHCIDRLLEESNRATSTIGYKMFIQLVVSNHPRTVVDYVNMYIDLLSKNVNRPVYRALSILWCVAQAGLSNLVAGLKVWLEIMLPVMNMRNLSNYCVLYLENLLEIHTGSLSSASEGLPKKEFFRLFDLLFADQSELTLDVRSRMKELYPKLKIIAWGNDGGSTLHNLFSSFLTRCQPDCSPRKKSELLSCLLECLTTDPQSFGVWRHAYTRHMYESSVLLKHLTDNFDKITVNRKLLYETVRAFHRTNEQLAEDPNFTKSRESARCIALCEELLNKLSAPKFSWRKLVCIVMVVLLSLVLCDFILHGGIKKSLSFRILEGYGVLAFLKHLWQRSLIYCSIIYEWLLVSVPYYYSKISEIVSPYVSLMWEKLGYAVVAVADSLRPAYEYVKSQVPTAIQWLEEKLPVVLEFAALCIGVVLTTIGNIAVWLYHLTSFYAVLLWNWLEQNVLTGDWSMENITNSLSNALLVLRSYIHRLYVWCASQVSS